MIVRHSAVYIRIHWYRQVRCTLTRCRGQKKRFVKTSKDDAELTLPAQDGWEAGQNEDLQRDEWSKSPLRNDWKNPESHPPCAYACVSLYQRQRHSHDTHKWPHNKLVIDDTTPYVRNITLLCIKQMTFSTITLYGYVEGIHWDPLAHLQLLLVESQCQQSARVA